MGLFILLLVIGIVIYASNNVAKANRQNWERAADQLKLVFNVGGGGRIGTISGKIHGHDITVSTFTRGSGNTSQTYTKYTLEYRERIPTDFKMVTQGLRHDVGKAFGLQDIEVGNPAFDDQILLQGGHPLDVVRFLTPRLQEEIRFLEATYPDFVITNELVMVNRRGADTDPAIIIQTVRRVAAFGDLITEQADPESPGVPTVEDAVERVIEPIEPSFNPLVSPNPIIPEPQWIEVAEEEPVAGIDSEPETAIEEPPDSVKPFVEVANPDEFVGSVTLDLKQVASELSGGGPGESMKSAKLFEQEYKGRQVAGTGVLLRVSKFSYDPVFKNCQGVKAVFDICELAGPYSKIKIAAVVKYPSEEYEALTAQSNASLPVAGTLVAYDSLMHQYFIEP